MATSHASMPTARAISEAAAAVQASWRLRIWRSLVIILILAHLFPIRFGVLRFAMLLAALLIWLGVPLLFWNRLSVRLAWVVATLLGAAMFFGPGRPVDQEALRG